MTKNGGLVDIMTNVRSVWQCCKSRKIISIVCNSKSVIRCSKRRRSWIGCNLVLIIPHWKSWPFDLAQIFKTPYLVTNWSISCHRNQIIGRTRMFHYRLAQYCWYRLGKVVWDCRRHRRHRYPINISGMKVAWRRILKIMTRNMIWSHRHWQSNRREILKRPMPNLLGHLRFMQNTANCFAIVIPSSFSILNSNTILSIESNVRQPNFRRWGMIKLRVGRNGKNQ